VKHFPGHGETVTDSHVELPILSVPRDVLAARELVPFRAAVRAGVRAVMVGHLAVPDVSGPDVPASLSPSIVEGLLRHELGFDGVVVTDALNMGAVAGESRPGEASVRAFLAGADVLLMPVNIEESIEAMVRAVASGRVSERRVEESLERIARLAATTRERDLPAPSYAGHEALALRVARRAVTRVRARAGSSSGRWPSSDGEALFVGVVDSERPPNLEFLSSALQKRSPRCGLRVISEVTPEEDLARLIQNARGASVLTLLVFDRPAAWRGSLGPSSVVREYLNEALRVSGEATVVVFGSPGLLPIFEAADTLLCAYDGSPPMQEAALDALLGVADAPGRLPSPSTRSAADGSG
jgi:beta-N-acetylhexosaminidase